MFRRQERLSFNEKLSFKRSTALDLSAMDELKKTYFSLLTPGVLALLAGYLISDFGADGGAEVARVLGPILFTLSAAAAVAVPVLVRTLFAHQVRHQTAIAKSDFLKFERRLLHVSLLTPYVTAAACFLRLPNFYIFGSFLMTLYGAYYYYPSERRIRFDQRIFKVR